MERMIESTKDQEVPEYETVKENKTLNSMVPLWKRPKSEITKEEFDQFYKEHFYDYSDPMKTIFFNVEGMSVLQRFFIFLVMFQRAFTRKIINQVYNCILGACSLWIIAKSFCPIICDSSRAW